MTFPKTKKALLDVLSDPYLFISKLKIKSKEGKLQSIKPSAEQIEIIKAFEEDNRHLVILKARQIGSSTIVAAYLFWRWYTSREPITIAILSHKLASSKHLLQMWFRFFDNLPDPLKRSLEIRTSTSMKLADTGAEVIAVSAEGHGGLRSFSANWIHLSEYAFAPNAEELKATAIASLNNGRLIQESTANHFSDAHHKDVLKAAKGEGDLRLLFFPWSDHVGYRKSGTIECTDEEIELIENHNLDEEQILWRRLMIQKLGSIHKFKREYPLTIEEAYGASSNAYFGEEDLRYLEIIDIDYSDGRLNIISSPSTTDAYAMGVDVSAGVGRDYSSIVVLSKSTWNPVAIWNSNTSSIQSVADVIEHLSGMYNPKIIIEENNIGHSLLMEVRSRGLSNLWRHPETGKDWQTNSKTKWQLFEDLKEALSNGAITTLDRATASDLRAFFVNDKGNIDFPKSLDGHGDSVMALALSIQALKVVNLPTKSFLPDWLVDRRIKKKTSALSLSHKRRY